LNYIQKSDIDWGQIFIFSPREKTKAALMKGQISENEKEMRLKYIKEKLKKEGYYIRNKSSANASIFIKKNAFINSEKNKSPFIVYYQLVLFSVKELLRKKE